MYGTCNYKWKISISRVAMRGTLTEKEREEIKTDLGRSVEKKMTDNNWAWEQV